MDKKIEAYLEKMEGQLNPTLQRWSQNAWVLALKTSCSSLVPFVIVGSLIALFGRWLEHATRISGTIQLIEVIKLLNRPYDASLGVLGFVFSLVFGYHLTKEIKVSKQLNLDPLQGLLLSMFGFLLTLKNPENNAVFFMKLGIEKGNQTAIVTGFPWDLSFSGISIIHAILIGTLTSYFYAWIIKNNIYLHLPTWIPEGVGRSLSRLIPYVALSLILLVCNWGLEQLSMSLYDFSLVILSGATLLTDTLWGSSIYIVVVHLLWVIGNHGPTLLGALVGPLMFTMLVINALGGTQILAGEYFTAFVLIGGSGSTLVVTLLMAKVAKSSELRELGELSVSPSLFNINEGLIFGVPIAFNPYFVFPFIASPLLNHVLVYYVIKAGWLDPVTFLHPWVLPLGMGGLFATGDWRALAVAVVQCLITFLMYYPFLKMYDRKKIIEEV